MALGDDPPPEYAGFADPRSSAEDGDRLEKVDAAIAAGKSDEAVSLIAKLVGEPPTGAAGKSKIDTDGDRLVSKDDVLYVSLAREVLRRVEKLPAPAKEKLSTGIGDAGAPAPAAAVDEEAWRPGGYARWAYPLKNERKLESSQPARNLYYSFYPMGLAALDDAVYVRSHQDVVALKRATGEVKWRVDSDVPVAEQTIHKENSRFSSWYYFTDVGGWSVTAVAGEPSRVVILNRPGQPSATQGKLAFTRNELRAYDAARGTLSWKRGGAEDKEEKLRGVTFASAPTLAGARGDVLAVPATTDDAFLVLAFTPDGEVLWGKRLYGYAADKAVRIGESMAFGAKLATDGDVIVGAPGHGLVFAINARGETLWESRYPSAVRTKTTEPRWAPGHPIVSAGKAIAAPFDGDCICAFDARTGVLAWSKRFLSGYYSLLGADAERAYVVSIEGRVTAFSLADGTVAWTAEGWGQPYGRGAVTGHGVYVTARRSIVVLDPRKGSVERKCQIWDEHVADPAPGNVFFSRGEVFLGAPWGFSLLEPYEETLKSADSLGLREQLLRKATVAHAMGKYADALESLKEVIAATSEGPARDSLRAEMLQVCQEAAVNTKDMTFVMRVIADPTLVPQRSLRTSFVLRSAEILEREAPAEAARLYRQIAEDPSSIDLVSTPDGIVADPGLYVSSVVGHLYASGKAAPAEEDESRVAAWIEAAGDEDHPLERLGAIALRWSHARAAAAAHARLARAAEQAGDTAAAVGHLERMFWNDPKLRDTADLCSYLKDLRRRLKEESGAAGAARLELDVSRPWRRVFLGSADGADLLSSADSSEPLPGMIIVKDGTFALLDTAGKVKWKHAAADFSGLKDTRARVQGSLVEPAWAHARGASVLLFGAAGLHEALGLGTDEVKVRPWLPFDHPLKRFAAPASGPAAKTAKTAKVAKAAPAAPEEKATGGPQAGNAITVNDNTNFFARVELGDSGDPQVAAADGTVTVFERRTGRRRASVRMPDQTSAGAPLSSGSLVATGLAKPTALAVDDVRARLRHIVPTPSTPWRGIAVPGFGAVVDCAAGIQVRYIPALIEPSLATSAAPPTLWRDLKARGLLALAYADAVRVVAVEPGGKLSGRDLRGGHVLWTTSFPEGASPASAFVVEDADGAPADLVIFASRGVDPEDGRGVLGQRVAQDLIVVRVGLSGEKRWELPLAQGAVAFGGARAIAKGGQWIVAFNHKTAEWRTRCVALDVEKGTATDLFELAGEDKPNSPPPRFLVTRDGIAVGATGRWALFAP